MIPMPSKADKEYELFADDDDPTQAEQLAKANAKAKAFREKEAMGMRAMPTLNELNKGPDKPKPKKRGRKPGSKNKAK